jgi:hypothetical protein
MTSSFFTNSSYLSVWETAIRWAGHDPDKIAEGNVPDEVKSCIKILIQGQLNGPLEIVTSEGITCANVEIEPGWPSPPINDQGMYIRKCDYFQWIEWVVADYQLFLKRPLYSKSELNNICVLKQEVGKWSLDEGFPFPDFWFTDAQKKTLYEESGYDLAESQDQKVVPIRRISAADIDQFWGRLSNSQRTRLLTREIATKLWENDPNLTIAEIERNETVQQYCGAKHYTDKDTIRNWIKDLDPRDASSRAGRPAKK